MIHFSNTIHSQITYESIKDSTINFKNSDEANLVLIVKNVHTFTEKSLDSIDVEILLSGPIFGTLLIELANNDKLTYENLYNEFIKFKKTSNYSNLYKIYAVTAELETTPANYENWEKDKKLLLALPINDEQLEEIRIYIKEHSNPDKNYKEVLSEYKAEKAKNTVKPNIDEFDSLLVNKGAINSEELLEKSRKENKPILIYFSGYAVINSQKLEQKVMKEGEIFQSLLNDFIFVTLYIDDTTELPADQWYESSVMKKTVKTVGDKNMDYEMTVFNETGQPFLACLNAENTKIATADYKINTVPLFEQFLKECLEKYKK